MLHASDAADWYWKVGNSADPVNTVYGSKLGDFVAITDLAYATWLANPNRKTSDIATGAALGEKLAQYRVPPAATTTQDIRDAYNDGVVDRMGPTLFKVLFNYQNRLRTLEGQSQMTPAQFKAVLRAISAGS